MRGELGEGLAVGQDGARRVPQEGRVPDAREAELHRQVLLERRVAEVLVHAPGAGQEALALGERVLQGQGEHADGGADGVAAADPVPEGEGVGLGGRAGGGMGSGEGWGSVERREGGDEEEEEEEEERKR